uniref:Nuclear transport factor 2 family protein n=1 Tax=Haemonchus contortus TaxID=6289 RepID=A0A7I4Y481_HAECO
TVVLKMLLILPFLACITASVADEDIGAILKPYYEKLAKAVESQIIEDAVRLYHSQGVIVKKNMYVVYGEKGITKDYEDVWKKLGRHTFTLSNQRYEGTDDYKIAEFDFEILSERVPNVLKGKMLHIWKKEGETLRIYHEQFEMKQ